MKRTVGGWKRRCGAHLVQATRHALQDTQADGFEDDVRVADVANVEAGMRWTLLVLAGDVEHGDG